MSADRHTPWGAYGLIALSVLSQSAGAALFKVGSEQARERLSEEWWAIIWTWLNPYFIGGLACLGVQTIAWMLVLRRLPLSRAYPFMACVLPVNLLIAVLYFSEQMSWNHLVGMILIGGGVVLVASAESEPVKEVS